MTDPLPAPPPPGETSPSPARHDASTSRALLITGLIAYTFSLLLPAVRLGGGDPAPGWICALMWWPTYVTNAFLLGAFPLWNMAARLRSRAAHWFGRVAGAIAVAAHIFVGAWLVHGETGIGESLHVGFYAWVLATLLVAAAFFSLPLPTIDESRRALPAAEQDRGLVRLAWSLAVVSTIGSVAGAVVAAEMRSSAAGFEFALPIAPLVLFGVFVAAARTRLLGWIWSGAALAALVALVGWISAGLTPLAGRWQSEAAARAILHGPHALFVASFLLLLRPAAREAAPPTSRAP